MDETLLQTDTGSLFSLAGIGVFLFEIRGLCHFQNELVFYKLFKNLAG